MYYTTTNIVITILFVAVFIISKPFPKSPVRKIPKLTFQVKTDERKFESFFTKVEKPKTLNTNESYGEMGKRVILPKELPDGYPELIAAGWKTYNFNQFVSDLISVNRSLPDLRLPKCKRISRVISNTTKTDVIIAFHNEAWSTLLRTVHSVLNRSPPHLIGEIILVDDFSDLNHTKQPLDDYFKNYQQIKILKTTRKEGAMKARMLGMKHSNSSVLTFMESSCECAEGWLEPLLERISQNSSTVVTPLINTISRANLGYSKRFSLRHFRGFNWMLNYKWDQPSFVRKEQGRRKFDPFHTPVFKGEVFLISRHFFEHLGTYDEDFDDDGYENLELSFKVWMCGGIIEINPCSNVGYLEKMIPNTFMKRKTPFRRNKVRIAEVWMDDYAKLFYNRIGNVKSNIGDVSSQKEFRKQCKSFQWYLENIYPEILQNSPKEPMAEGYIRSLAGRGRYCMKSLKSSRIVGFDRCNRLGGPQFWIWSKTGEIRFDDMCLTNTTLGVILNPCSADSELQHWDYEEYMLQIKKGDQCLAVNKFKIFLFECDSKLSSQKWILEKYNSSRNPLLADEFIMLDNTYNQKVSLEI